MLLSMFTALWIPREEPAPPPPPAAPLTSLHVKACLFPNESEPRPSKRFPVLVGVDNTTVTEVEFVSRGVGRPYCGVINTDLPAGEHLWFKPNPELFDAPKGTLRVYPSPDADPETKDAIETEVVQKPRLM